MEIKWTNEEMDDMMEMRKLCKNGFQNQVKLESQAYAKACFKYGEKPLGVRVCEWQALQPYMEKWNEMKQRQKDDKNDHWALMLTYNPPEEKANYLHVNEIKKNLERLKYFNPHQKASSIEQRGSTEDEMGKGAHCHILWETHTNGKSRWLAKLGQCLKKYKLYDNKTKKFDPSIDLKWYFKYEQEELTIPKKIDYINGLKGPLDKIAKVKIDKKWREINKSVCDFS